MPSLTTDIAIAYIWLALSATAVFAGFVAKFGSAGRWPWAVITGGLCLLAWSVYNIYPTLSLARPGGDVSQLQQEVALREREIARLQQTLDAAEKAARADREQYEQRLAKA